MPKETILSKDIEGEKLQGFEPQDILAATDSVVLDISDYIAFRVSANVSYQFTLDGVITTNSATLPQGAITLCDKMDSVTFDADVNIEVM